MSGAIKTQLAILREMAEVLGAKAQAEIEDSVKRHLRIMKQKPEVGRLALSIANLEAALLDAGRADDLTPEELAKEAEALKQAAARRGEIDGRAGQAEEQRDPAGGHAFICGEPPAD